MKIIPSALVAICAIPSVANAALRGSETAAANTSSSELVNVDDADASSSHRKLPYDSSGNWYWEYEGYTYTTTGTYEDRFCYYYQSNIAAN